MKDQLGNPSSLATFQMDPEFQGGLKVAFMLRALDVPFETVHVDFLKGATRDPA
jgi:hypothetical protein